MLSCSVELRLSLAPFYRGVGREGLDLGEE